jgi:hypothetical protein
VRKKVSPRRRKAADGRRRHTSGTIEALECTSFAVEDDRETNEGS